MYPKSATQLMYLITLFVLVGSILAEDETEPKTTAFPVDNLNEKLCNNTLKGCCDVLYMGEEDDLMKCLTLHQNNIPENGDTDPAKLFKFLSCFVECVYKQKKYVGKGDNINMKMVKLDAQKMYDNRPKERDYHINMYEYCSKDALNMYNLIKSNPAGQLIIRTGCKPYLMFVFLCQAEYHKKKTCPYFRWQGSEKANNEEKCKAAKNKCYEIDGIEL